MSKRHYKMLGSLSVLMIIIIILLAKFVLVRFRLSASQMVMIAGCFAIFSYCVAMVIMKNNNKKRLSVLITVLTLSLSLCTFYLTNRYILPSQPPLKRQGGVLPTMPSHFEEMKKEAITK